MKVNMYVADPVHSEAVHVLAQMIKQAYQPRLRVADRAEAMAG